MNEENFIHTYPAAVTRNSAHGKRVPAPPGVLGGGLGPYAPEGPAACGRSATLHLSKMLDFQSKNQGRIQAKTFSKYALKATDRFFTIREYHWKA